MQEPKDGSNGTAKTTCAYCYGVSEAVSIDH